MSTTPTPVKIRLRSLPPLAGLSWIRRGFRMFWRRPLGFTGLWLFFTLCVFIIAFFAVAISPLVMLAVAAWMPLLSVGFMQAATDVLDGRKLRPAVFRISFTTSPQSARGMAAVMLIYVAAVAVLAACANAMDGGETQRWLHAAATPGPDGKPPALAPLGPNSVSALRFVMLGLTLISIPLWYVPALVQWGGQGLAQALFSSVVALWRTKGAFLTFLAGWAVVGFLFDALIQVLAGVFGVEAVSLAALTGQMILSITYFLSLWFGFVDTFEISAPPAFRTVMAEAEPPAN